MEQESLPYEKLNTKKRHYQHGIKPNHGSSFDHHQRKQRRFEPKKDFDQMSVLSLFPNDLMNSYWHSRIYKEPISLQERKEGGYTSHVSDGKTIAMHIPVDPTFPEKTFFGTKVFSSSEQTSKDANSTDVTQPPFRAMSHESCLWITSDKVYFVFFRWVSENLDKNLYVATCTEAKREVYSIYDITHEMFQTQFLHLMAFKQDRSVRDLQQNQTEVFSGNAPGITHSSKESFFREWQNSLFVGFWGPPILAEKMFGEKSGLSSLGSLSSTNVFRPWTLSNILMKKGHETIHGPPFETKFRTMILPFLKEQQLFLTLGHLRQYPKSYEWAITKQNGIRGENLPNHLSKRILLSLPKCRMLHTHLPLLEYHPPGDHFLTIVRFSDKSKKALVFFPKKSVQLSSISESSDILPEKIPSTYPSQPRELLESYRQVTVPSSDKNHVVWATVQAKPQTEKKNQTNHTPVVTTQVSVGSVCSFQAQIVSPEKNGASAEATAFVELFPRSVEEYEWLVALFQVPNEVTESNPYVSSSPQDQIDSVQGFEKTVLLVPIVKETFTDLLRLDTKKAFESPDVLQERWVLDPHFTDFLKKTAMSRIHRL